MSSDSDVMPVCKSSIAPWLAVSEGTRAVAFYKSAFGATEVYRLDGDSGIAVARLSVGGAEFWVGEEAAKPGNASRPLGEPSIRMILTVADPDAVFDQAVKAGAAVVSPIHEGHGWRVGRVVDPFGHHWEIGREIDL